MTEFGDSVYEQGVEDAEYFDGAETLTSDDPDEALDTSYSPPDFEPTATKYGTTEFEQAQGEPLDVRLRQEEPDITDVADEPADPRAGRLLAPDEGGVNDTEKDEIAEDVGMAGYAASAEEAAMHVVDEERAVDPPPPEGS